MALGRAGGRLPLDSARLSRCSTPVGSPSGGGGRASLGRWTSSGRPSRRVSRIGFLALAVTGDSAGRRRTSSAGYGTTARQGRPRSRRTFPAVFRMAAAGRASPGVVSGRRRSTGCCACATTRSEITVPPGGPATSKRRRLQASPLRWSASRGGSPTARLSDVSDATDPNGRLVSRSPALNTGAVRRREKVARARRRAFTSHVGAASARRPTSCADGGLLGTSAGKATYRAGGRSSAARAARGPGRASTCASCFSSSTGDSSSGRGRTRRSGSLCGTALVVGRVGDGRAELPGPVGCSRAAARGGRLSTSCSSATSGPRSKGSPGSRGRRAGRVCLCTWGVGGGSGRRACPNSVFARRARPAPRRRLCSAYAGRQGFCRSAPTAACGTAASNGTGGCWHPPVPKGDRAAALEGSLGSSGRQGARCTFSKGSYARPARGGSTAARGRVATHLPGLHAFGASSLILRAKKR